MSATCSVLTNLWQPINPLDPPCLPYPVPLPELFSFVRICPHLCATSGKGDIVD